MDVAHVLETLEELAPGALAEPWDNVGLLVGRRDRPVGRLLVALDLRHSVMDEAAEGGHRAILVHHPPIFPHLDAVTDRQRGGLILRAAEMGVAVIAAHTNLDSAAGGLNDIMADLLGMTDTAPLSPHSTDPAVGLGRIGTVAPTTVAELARRAGAAFALRPSHTGDPAAPVMRVACCTGSGASLIGPARAAGADAYVTGDLKYHDADMAEDLPLICADHAPVEAEALRRWSATLARALAPAGVAVDLATHSTDPWQKM